MSPVRIVGDGPGARFLAYQTRLPILGADRSRPVGNAARRTAAPISRVGKLAPSAWFVRALTSALGLTTSCCMVGRWVGRRRCGKRRTSCPGRQPCPRRRASPGADDHCRAFRVADPGRAVGRDCAVRVAPEGVGGHRVVRPPGGLGHRFGRIQRATSSEPPPAGTCPDRPVRPPHRVASAEAFRRRRRDGSSGRRSRRGTRDPGGGIANRR